MAITPADQSTTVMGSVREISSEKLIGKDLSTFATQHAFRTKQVKIYLHQETSSVDVSGGMYGPQTVDTVAIDSGLKSFAEQLVSQLDPKLGLAFSFVQKASDANIRVYLDRKIDLEDSGSTVGITLSNQTPTANFWEIFLSADLLSDPSFLRFAFVHELGHSLGLEHPFDASDGDLDLSTDPRQSANVEETAMAYRSDNGLFNVTDFTGNDLRALQRLWGGSSPTTTPTTNPSVAATPVKPPTTRAATPRPVTPKQSNPKQINPVRPTTTRRTVTPPKPIAKGSKDPITGQSSRARTLNQRGLMGATPVASRRPMTRTLPVLRNALERTDWFAQQPLPTSDPFAAMANRFDAVAPFAGSSPFPAANLSGLG